MFTENLVDRLNYHHLRYFWTVASEGSVSKASALLHVAQPTISGQLRELETALGEKLFRKAGRGLALTESGQIVFRYAEEIFSMGRELLDTLKGRPTGRPLRLTVGVADGLPKLVAYRLIEPAMQLADHDNGVQIVCCQDNLERLLVDLAGHSIDVILADAAATPSATQRTYNHPLGKCDVAVFGAPPLVEAFAAGFPESLNNAPFLLPTPTSALRRTLDHWFETQGIFPDIKAEIQDSALPKVFGQAGIGLFVAPTIVSHEIEQQYAVRCLGRLAGLHERFYAISAERRLKHPAVVAVLESARQKLMNIA
jgi:LysR family transcriptional activator of nhaA